MLSQISYKRDTSVVWNVLDVIHPMNDKQPKQTKYTIKQNSLILFFTHSLQNSF